MNDFLDQFYLHVIVVFKDLINPRHHNIYKIQENVFIMHPYKNGFFLV